MTHTIEKSLGQGLSSNFITFSSGIGVTGSVSAEVSWADILALASNPQNVEKQNARWILPNDCPSRKRYLAEYSRFGLLWADVDDMQGKSIESLYESLNKPFALVYATKSATVDNQRCRVLIPLNKGYLFDDWLILQRGLNEAILRHCCVVADDSNLKASQILFLPNRGEYYEAILPKVDRPANPSRYLAECSEKGQHTPTMALQKPIQHRSTPPGGSVIYRFNAAFSVSDILNDAGYYQCPFGPLRWRHPNSESGSYSATISPETGRVHSLSPRDPLYTGGGGGGAHDAFGAFCVLFCGNDMRTAVYRADNEFLQGEVRHVK